MFAGLVQMVVQKFYIYTMCFSPSRTRIRRVMRFICRGVKKALYPCCFKASSRTAMARLLPLNEHKAADSAAKSPLAVRCFSRIEDRVIVVNIVELMRG